MTDDEILKRFAQRKSKHLVNSILLDLGGMASYLLPFLGEGFDFIYAPFYGIAIFSMYRMRAASAAIGGMAGFVEEIIPMASDWIPTASIMWAYNYVLNRDSTLNKFVKRMDRDREVINNARSKNYEPKTNPIKRIGKSIVSIFYEFPQEPKEYTDYTEISSDDNKTLSSGELKSNNK